MRQLKASIIRIYKVWHKLYFGNYLQHFSHLLHPVHTTPEEFGNVALFLRSFSKTRFKFDEWDENVAFFRFSVDRKHFESGAFGKWWRHDNHVISLQEFSSNTNRKLMTGLLLLFYFLMYRGHWWHHAAEYPANFEVRYRVCCAK